MNSVNEKAEPVRVRRRHVVYAQGYDPRGLAEYYPLFRSEFRKFCTLYGVTGKISRPAEQPERYSTVWRLETKASDWQVETTYEFLRWEDIIRRDFARPVWWKVLHGFGALFHRMIWQGGLAQVARTNWRPIVFVLYPYLTFVAHLLVAAFGGVLIARIADALFAASAPATIAGLAAFAAIFVLLVRGTERYSYMLYLFDDIASNNQFGMRQRPDWDERFELFAGYLIEAARNSGADEVVVVGHSSGSCVAVDVLARALERDPDLGRHGPRVAMLTVGANLPSIGFNKDAGWFRDRLARIAVEPAVDWVDYQSRKDVMNMYPFDPIAGHGIELGAARRNPRVVSVRFRDIIKPESYPRFRWRFFRVHFQFLMANERRGSAYDYFMICCGPFDLMTRATRPKEVVAAVEPKGSPPAPVGPPDDDTAP